MAGPSNPEPQWVCPANEENVLLLHAGQPPGFTTRGVGFRVTRRRSLDAIHRRFGAGTDTVPFLIKVLLQGGFVMPCFIQLFVMLKSSDRFYAQIVLSLVAPSS